MIRELILAHISKMKKVNRNKLQVKKTLAKKPSCVYSPCSLKCFSYCSNSASDQLELVAETMLSLWFSALALELIERTSNEEQRSESSSASIQHFPAADDGARKIKYEVGNGCMRTAPIDSFSGPRGAQID